MTQLRRLALNDVGLNGHSAMRLFSRSVPSLLHLQFLSVEKNLLGTGLAMVLATSAPQLPALEHVAVSEGNDLAVPGDGVPGSLIDLNGIVGRILFW